MTLRSDATDSKTYFRNSARASEAWLQKLLPRTRKAAVEKAKVRAKWWVNLVELFDPVHRLATNELPDCEAREVMSHFAEFIKPEHRLASGSPALKTRTPRNYVS